LELRTGKIVDSRRKRREKPSRHGVAASSTFLVIGRFGVRTFCSRNRAIHLLSADHVQPLPSDEPEHAKTADLPRRLTKEFQRFIDLLSVVREIAGIVVERRRDPDLESLGLHDPLFRCRVANLNRVEIPYGKSISNLRSKLLGILSRDETVHHGGRVKRNLVLEEGELAEQARVRIERHLIAPIDAKPLPERNVG